MKKLFLALLLFALPLKAEVYDCFMFFNELELLKVRLAELDPVVDHFVIVESLESHQGYAKPLYFHKNRSEFAPYLHKIIHVIFERCPHFQNPWHRENAQRNAILRGLRTAAPSDLIMISDCDEIPRKEVVLQLEQQLESDLSQVFQVFLTNYKYKLNGYVSPRWPGTMATSLQRLNDYSPQDLRDRCHAPFPDPVLTRIENGGWHFSYMGGDEAVRTKANNFAHNEFHNRGDELIAQFKKYPFCPIDSTYPEYIRANEEYFLSIGYIQPPD